MLPGLLLQLQRHLAQYPRQGDPSVPSPPAMAELRSRLRRLPHSPPVAALGLAVAGAFSAATAAGFPEGANRVFSQIAMLLPAKHPWPEVRALLVAFARICG